MQQSQNANTPKQLSREQRWEIVRTLLQHSNLSSEAKQAFHQAYPNAPEEMELASNGDIEAILAAVEELESMFKGGRNYYLD
ncbi:hypothetical protein [Nostoc sp.]|uniref:hypothetical protein n=1 Tax=Nostoc sp. TaxID=1180 RepID=UPI002FFA88F2